MLARRGFTSCYQAGKQAIGAARLARCFSHEDHKHNLFKEYKEVKVPFYETRPYDKQKMNTTSYKVSDPQEYVERVFSAALKPGEKKVMFIRHAISVGNTLNLIYGLSDYPLTDKGQEQAKALEPIFSRHKHRFQEFVCSGLQRTRQTGGLVLGLGIAPTEQQIRTDLNFNEYNFGHNSLLSESEHLYWFSCTTVCGLVVPCLGRSRESTPARWTTSNTKYSSSCRLSW